VLGPLTVHHDDSPAELGPPARRAILALLALAPGELVRRSSIIDALWPHGPPPTAVDKIHAHVSRLRRLVDPGRFRRDPAGLLACVPGGYQLRVSPAQLDLLAFGDLVRRARSAGTAGNPGVACDRYEQALGLWRDEPAADVCILADHPAVVGLDPFVGTWLDDIARARGAVAGREHGPSIAGCPGPPTGPAAGRARL
jgi:DNA-binding winged helix-turn-helix (wHTH) protein